jgi:hypothetical protein
MARGSLSHEVEVVDFQEASQEEVPFERVAMGV